MFACAREQIPLEELTVKEYLTYEVYSIRILETAEKGYKELSYQDMQSSVESLYRRRDYLGKRRGFKKIISPVV